VTPKHTHPNNCEDSKEAAADRRARALVTRAREERQQAAAHTIWFDWYAPHIQK
jgi:hypothetical protein